MEGCSRKCYWFARTCPTVKLRDSSLFVTADPDLSNPTRSRMERPLDTIRSFEAAVEGTYNSRKTVPSRPGMSLFEDGGRSLLIVAQYLRRHTMEPAGEAAILEVCYIYMTLQIFQDFLTASCRQRQQYKWSFATMGRLLSEWA